MDQGVDSLDEVGDVEEIAGEGEVVGHHARPAAPTVAPIGSSEAAASVGEAEAGTAPVALVAGAVVAGAGAVGARRVGAMLASWMLWNLTFELSAT